MMNASDKYQLLDHEKDWPYNQDYLSECSHCHEKFVGPKRAPACWVCTGPDDRYWWEHKNKIAG